MKPGVDSAFGPTVEQVQAAEADSIGWWGGYIGGPGAYRVWPDSELVAVRDSGIVLLPIWVPSASLAESSTDAAWRAVGTCVAFGLGHRVVALDTEAGMDASDRLRPYVDGWCATVSGAGFVPVVYAGAGYLPAGVAGWRPLWGSSEVPAAGQAVQYGPVAGGRWGLPVDNDQADDLFPLFGPVPVPPLPEEGDLSNLVIYHDTTTLVWKLVNTATDTLVANLTGDPEAVASFEAAGGKVLAWAGAGAQFN